MVAAAVDQDCEIELPASVEVAENNRGWLKWCPTDMSLLRAAESKILKYVKTPFLGKFVNIGNKIGGTESKIWTLMFNQESKKMPLILLHGFASGVGLWCLNLDAFASQRPVYAMDILGFARSSRPSFSRNALEAESEIVDSIEEWRKKVGIEKFVLLGHSMGGFLASAYALQHPDRVAHVILADPWGFPDRPGSDTSSASRIQIPFWIRGIAYLLQPFNPLWIVRVSGPLGPKLVKRARPDIFQKFRATVDNADTTIADYIYHCNAQNPTGESAFHAMMESFGWAKFPMLHRISALRADVPITFIYGARSWVDRHPGQIIKETRSDSFVELHVIKGAGHHVYADKCDEFNSLVLKACEASDCELKISPSKEDISTSEAEEKVHQVQTETSQSVLGALQATEFIESP